MACYWRQGNHGQEQQADEREGRQGREQDAEQQDRLQGGEDRCGARSLADALASQQVDAHGTRHGRGLGHGLPVPTVIGCVESVLMILDRWIAARSRWAEAKATIAEMQRDGFGRRCFKDGFAEGYAAGIEDQAAGRPSRIAVRYMSEHPQTEIYGIEVDVEMAPLLEALWRLALDTQFSCQGDPNRYLPHQAYTGEWASQIVFGDFEHALKFVRKTTELLGHAAFLEGGFAITPMDPTDETLRAEVRFSPKLLPEVTSKWVAFQQEVFNRQELDETVVSD